MKSDGKNISTLSAAELLQRYRERLPPGAYFYVGLYIGENETARPAEIQEIYVPPKGQSNNHEQRVAFGFFERGCPPPDLVQKGPSNWIQRYPFSHHVASTSMEFQEKVASHVRARLRDMLAGSGTTKAVGS